VTGKRNYDSRKQIRHKKLPKKNSGLLIKGSYSLTAEDIIKHMGLERHPEGGYYKEFYKSNTIVPLKEEEGTFEQTRYSATSIYFLLSAGDISTFHRLKFDEVWYYHSGSPLDIYMINQGGELSIKRLGAELIKGEEPQILVSAGTIFGAKCPDDSLYTLLGCMVTPGFDFGDFELFSRSELLALYPRYHDIIIKLTHS
jgi:predicted cupin superfamily sugar epimerase